MPKDLEELTEKEEMKVKAFSDAIVGGLPFVVLIVIFISTPREDLFWPIMGGVGLIMLFALIGVIQKRAAIIGGALSLVLWFTVAISLFVVASFKHIFWGILILLVLKLLFHFVLDVSRKFRRLRREKTNIDDGVVDADHRAVKPKAKDSKE